MSRWTRKQMLGFAGHGDHILATVHDPAERWYWSDVTDERGFFDFDFRARRGRVDVLPGLANLIRRIAPSGHVVVEPHSKRRFSAGNKDWGWHKWQEVVASVKLPFLQLLYPGAVALKGVRTFATPSFDLAQAVLSISSGLATTNGGLQYAAAALDIPAVIVWGSFAPPQVIGYAEHANLAVDDPEGLGWRIPHAACRKAMDQIETGAVAATCLKMFAEKVAA